MIQVALCEQALIKTNRKPFRNHQSKTMLLLKTYTLEFESDRYLEAGGGGGGTPLNKGMYRHVGLGIRFFRGQFLPGQ